MEADDEPVMEGLVVLVTDCEGLLVGDVLADDVAVIETLDEPVMDGLIVVV